jgi:hypothetical protein
VYLKCGVLDFFNTLFVCREGTVENRIKKGECDAFGCLGPADSYGSPIQLSVSPSVYRFLENWNGLSNVSPEF